MTFTTILLLLSFCIRLPFNPMQIRLCCPYHLCSLMLILPSSSTTPNLAVTEVLLAATGAPMTTGIAANTGLIFVVLIPLLPRTGSGVIGSKPNGLLVLGSGLLTSHLSRTSSVRSASTSATQPHNVLSFIAAVTSPLPILLSVLILLILGSKTLV